jgi:G3E family GTPase
MWQGASKKKQDDQEVNTTDRGDRGDHRDHGDHRYHRNHQHQSSDQKEKRPFHHPTDAEMWCEIHHTVGHDLERCKYFLDHKKVPPPAPMAQEPYRGKHRQADPDNEDQMGKINVIFRGSMPITSKTQEKKLKQEITLAHASS